MELAEEMQEELSGPSVNRFQPGTKMMIARQDEDVLEKAIAGIAESATGRDLFDC
jgi:hypothetical protein